MRTPRMGTLARSASSSYVIAFSSARSAVRGGKPFLAQNDFRREQSAVAMIIFPLTAGLSCAPGRAARLVVS